MLLEVCRILEQPLQEPVRHIALDRPGSDTGVLMEVLPEGTPVTAPPLAVRHEPEVQVFSRTTEAIVNQSREDGDVREGHEDSQLEHNRLLPVRGVCGPFVEELLNDLRASENDD